MSVREQKFIGSAPIGMRQDLLRRVLDGIDVDELARLLSATENAIAGRDERGGGYGTLRDGGFSTGARTIYLTILQLSRRSRDSSIIERTNAIRELLRIKEEVGFRKLAAACGDRDAAPQAAVTDPDSTPDAVRVVYRSLVGRVPGDEEIRIWETNFSNGITFQKFVNLMFAAPEAQAHGTFLPGQSDGRFIQILYEIFFERGAVAREIEHWQRVLDAKTMGRLDIVRQCFEHAFNQLASERDEDPHDAYAFHVLGSTKKITIADWKQRAAELDTTPGASAEREADFPRFHINTGSKVLVSAIASLYKGGKYIEQFLDNLCSQSIFDDACELIIVDADSPENERETIERYTRRHKNIVYQRMNYRIGIYDAWNVGVELSRGEYLTNTNLDDLRRRDSLELQASVLDALPFTDVVYQDFFYTFDPDLSFEEIARFGYKSQLPVITPYNLMDFNSPHNAPMWRKALHAELGKFDISYKSAGDYEFWMRCLSAGKVFYKLNEPLVIYYQNPEGLSTRPDTRGLEEARRILKKYARKLVSDNVVCDRSEFLARIGLEGPVGGELEPGARYADAQTALRKLASGFKRNLDARRG